MWPADLDRLATSYVKNKSDRDETISEKEWMQHLMGILKTLDCGCERRCTRNCRHNGAWLPPKSLQGLARTMIEADTLAEGSCLTKSPLLEFYTSSKGAEKHWGARAIDDPRRKNNDYFYAPSVENQARALKRAKQNKAQAWYKNPLEW